MIPGVETIERAGLSAWPGIDVQWDGTWVRRASNGYTKRANSFQSFDPSDDADAADRINDSARWLAERGVPAVARVTPLTPAGVITAFDDLGWTAIEQSDVLAMVIEPVTADPRAVLYDLSDERFFAAQQRLHGYSDQTLGRLRALLAVMTVPATGIVVLSREGEPVASALMAVADGIVVTGNVVTDPNQRRQGYGGALMRTGHAWAHAAGARIAALNMTKENDPARALYEGLGYRLQYSYSYRIPAEAP